jgi:hypothetical protein
MGDLFPEQIVANEGGKVVSLFGICSHVPHCCSFLLLPGCICCIGGYSCVSIVDSKISENYGSELRAASTGLLGTKMQVNLGLSLVPYDW